MSALNDFIGALRLERLRQRIKQIDLARDLGLVPSHLSAWENLVYTPTDVNLRRWAAQLGVPVPEGIRGFDDAPAECGTLGGHKRHRRRGEQTCPACRRALADYMRDYRRRSVASPP